MKISFDKPDKFQPWYSYGFNKDMLNKVLTILINQ